MSSATFTVDIKVFKEKALAWAQKFEEIAYLNSSGYTTDEYAALDSVLAVQAVSAFESKQIDTFQNLQDFRAKHSTKWMFGFFSYDLKNEIENLSTNKPDRLKFPNAAFFVPQILIKFKKEQVDIIAPDPASILAEIETTAMPEIQSSKTLNIEVKSRMSKSDYTTAFHHTLQHIKRGDIYEVNLCQEFYAEETTIQPLQVYKALSATSPTPFSTFFKWKDKYVLSASPERFLAKRANTLISQPIKGTAARGKNKNEDEQIIQRLQNDPKEIAENIMIVDLVRNDLTISAKPGSVDASKTLEIHSFKQVHQLISTITCQQAIEIDDVTTIKNTFPPGSMTGAPKVSAMQICEKYENSRRGLYSGSIGYFAPNGDFDFNVIIRSILYNETLKYLSFHTGGAITLSAELDNEYQECLLKASAILQVLNADIYP